jgi:cytosine/uracil/thiamine/allantoin permease
MGVLNMATMLYGMTLVAVLFWVLQVLDLLLRDETEFESHAHKLLWFVALFTGTIIAAIWYWHWKKRTVAPRVLKAEE